MLIIAKKELAGFLSNKWVLFILAIYLTLVLSSIFSMRDQIPSDGLADGQLFSVMLGWSKMLIYYGAIIGMIIGFTSLSNEKYGNALSTLLAKPLYRDTIINGKIIACVSFLLAIFGLTISLYIALVLIIFGTSSAHLLLQVLNRTSILFFISFLYTMIFMLLAMLMSILVKRQSLAFLLSILSYFLTTAILPTVSFAGNIYNVFGEQAYNFVINLFPNYAYGILVMQGLYDPACDVMSLLSTNWANFLLFPLYVVILIVLCYVSFLRRDV
jgi:ABC-2 type transport system permease protein